MPQGESRTEGNCLVTSQPRRVLQRRNRENLALKWQKGKRWEVFSAFSRFAELRWKGMHQEVYPQHTTCSFVFSACGQIVPAKRLSTRRVLFPAQHYHAKGVLANRCRPKESREQWRGHPALRSSEPARSNVRIRLADRTTLPAPGKQPHRFFAGCPAAAEHMQLANRFAPSPRKIAGPPRAPVPAGATLPHPQQHPTINNSDFLMIHGLPAVALA